MDAISLSELEALLVKALGACSREQREAFDAHRVPPYQVKAWRANVIETLFVVAKFHAGIVYYDDVEEGFEIARLASDGSLHLQSASQDPLKLVLHRLGF
ncbi:hypothethical protein (plasmid) [Ralstonia solanacearum CMR15]|nr:hypothethical protein [Ralstonia solanacearum CMR15]